MCTKTVNFCFVFVLTCVFGISFASKTDPQKRVCVIGAGIAGLTSAYHMKQEGINFTVFESTQYIGGTWRYEPRVGTDEYGMPIHSSMYKHLRTNLPKPTMQLKDFPVPDDIPSYPTWEMYYEYLKAYAKHFDLEKHIKFLHLVTSVRRDDGVWKVKTKHIPSGKESEGEYDYVIIGSGHHSKPKIPDIPNENLFKGTIIHSHDYKDPQRYMDRRVLIVGAGPSGMDISLDVAKCCKTLVHSRHTKLDWKTPFPENYIKKPDVKEFNETGAIFVDGTYEDLDDVIYCTGFEYHYPFLDESTGLTISRTSVVPLYKYMVNIHQPTMLFMGLVVRACLVVAIDTQAQYATALIKGNFTLPPKEQMLEDWQKRADAILARGRPLSDIHLLAQDEDEYYASLTEESGIPRVPPVLFKIRMMDTQAKLDNLYTYRDYIYTIIDDETFTRHLGPSSSTNSCTA